jgi:hypothetical protein
VAVAPCPVCVAPLPPPPSFAPSTPLAPPRPAPSRLGVCLRPGSAQVRRPRSGQARRAARALCRPGTLY